MKMLLILLVIISVLVLLGLIVFSFKLLRKSQQEELEQRRVERLNRQSRK